MPRGDRRLPDRCVPRLQSAELILHAGDLVRASVLRELQQLGELIAVHGNVDDHELREMLPTTTVVEVGGAIIGLVHDAGAARGRAQRLRALFPEADAVVFGHSHIPLHERIAGGFQLFNPGSPTERRRAPQYTMGIARADMGQLTFELVSLG